MAKRKFKKLKGFTKEELYLLFLDFREFKDTLFVYRADGGAHMPSENEPEFYRAAQELMMKMNLRDWTEIDGEVFTKPSLWEFIRQPFKCPGDEEYLWDTVEIIYERWGDFQRCDS